MENENDINFNKITIDADALYQVLVALNGPPHYIRELMTTRNLPLVNKNPIDILTDEYSQSPHLMRSI